VNRPPRVDAAAVRLALLALLPDEQVVIGVDGTEPRHGAWAWLAAELKVDKQAISRALRHGMTARLLGAWTARGSACAARALPCPDGCYP
jgi:hypothetical protein